MTRPWMPTSEGQSELGRTILYMRNDPTNLRWTTSSRRDGVLSELRMTRAAQWRGATITQFALFAKQANARAGGYACQTCGVRIGEPRRFVAFYCDRCENLRP